jgi:hypothetical protein
MAIINIPSRVVLTVGACESISWATSLTPDNFFLFSFYDRDELWGSTIIMNSAIINTISCIIEAEFVSTFTG